MNGLKHRTDDTSDLANNDASHQYAGDSERNSHVQKLAWLLDKSIRLPGGFRIGLDGILGLIPGVGDAVSGAISTYIVVSAYRLGASKWLLTRMMGNVVLDFVFGSIPVVGDIFDFVFKANSRNLKLLEKVNHSDYQSR